MKNIKRWVDKNLIDENLASILENELKEENEKKAKFLTQITLYTIGVIFIATGVICFVAGNDWIIELFNKFPLFQTTALLLISIFSLFAGWKLKYDKQNFQRLGGALIFLSTLLIGCVYIQMGQKYNWSTNASSVLSLWFISIFPLAFIFKSKAINWLSIILFIIIFPYYYYDLNIDKINIWTIFMPISLCGILYTFANIPLIEKKFIDFALSYKLCALTIIFFTFLILIFSINPSYQMINPYYIIIPVVLILVNLWSYLQDKTEYNLKKNETYFLVFLMIFMLVLLIAPVINPIIANILSHLFLIYIVSNMLYWGYKFENISLINLSNFFLLIYILSIYCRYGWSFIDKTLFFLIGGIILLGCGIYLEKRKKAWISNKNSKEQE